MGAYWTLTRRELGSYFLSFTGYIIIAAAVFLLGFSFVVILRNLGMTATPMPITEMFFITQLFWLVLLLGPPVITMRLFALERFSGTFETLMTTPVSDLQVVLAKYTAAMIFYVIMWLPLLGCLLVVRYFTSASNPLDVGALGATFLGISLLGSLFISFGCCASSLTRNQAVAAIISLAFGVSVFLLGVLAGQVSNGSTWQSEALASVAFFEQMHDFSRGVVDTRSVVLLLSVSLFFLFLTLRIVDSRRWK
jgi:ABC-2 type transport system permease protein